MDRFIIYIFGDYADTMRDPSEPWRKDLAIKDTIGEALSFAEDYIKNHFLRKDTKLKIRENGNYSASNFISWGETIHIDKILS